MRGVFEALGLDPEATTPGRMIVREKGKALVAAMQKALKDAPEAAQIVAGECVVDAETKDHATGSSSARSPRRSTERRGQALDEAYEEVEDEEDEHLYHTRGGAGSCGSTSLGMPAVLPPPEEEEDVETAVAEARVNQQRKEAVKRNRRKIEAPQAKKSPGKRPRA